MSFSPNHEPQKTPKINSPDQTRSLRQSSDYSTISYQRPLNAQELTSISGGDNNSSNAVVLPSFSPNAIPHYGDSNEGVNHWSSSFQTLLDQPPATFPRQLISGGMVFLLAFSAWAWFGTVEEVGKARGKLVPEGETYKIQPIDIGQVEQVAVQEGQRVEAGQLLVTLDADLDQKEIDRLQQLIKSYQIELGQKQALRERIELEAKTQTAIAASNLLVQQAAVSLAQDKKATISQLLTQQRQAANAYQSRQQQRQPLSAIAGERIEQLQAEQKAHQERLDRLQSLEAEGAISKEYIFQAEQALRDTQQRLTSSQLQEIPNTDEQLFQAGQQLRDLNVQITQNEGDLLKANSEHEQAKATLISQQAEAHRIQLEASQRIQQLDVEITQLQGKIGEANNGLISAKKKLQNKYLTAPISGTILTLNLKNEGEVVEPGQTVAEIAPDGVPLIVSAMLPNQEAGFVKPGMPVQVKLDAYPYQDYGVISGQVTTISADAKSDKTLGEVYKVEVKLDRDHITKNQKVIPFKAGLAVNAEIIIRERRILDVLLDPIKQIQKDGIDL
ncbi:MAG: HlyD family efflux transporter periplasmic adaptor subunit [Synechocystis sp.]|nr:HlyD family efflux transporter periplasmic adaptor subunit [Synechocystis sp.]